MWVQFKDSVQSALSTEEKFAQDEIGGKWYEVPKKFNSKTQYLILVNGVPKIAGQSFQEKLTEEKEKLKKEKPLNDILKLYHQREKDGLRTFNNFRANLVLKLEKGELTISQILLLENELEPVINKIRSGDWYSAQNAMNKMTPPLDETKIIYQEINNVIDGYVTENYGKV